MAISGAGSAITDIAECGQCLFCAARFQLGGGTNNDLNFDDIALDMHGSKLKGSTKKMLDRAYNDCDIDLGKLAIDKVFTLDESWWHSLISTANLIYKKYRNKKYIFHKGSQWVRQIESGYKLWNKATEDRLGSYFTNINKYTPADIWMTTKKGLNEKFKEPDNFAKANKILLSAYNTRDIIGVSLKKTKKAHIELFNMPGKEHYDIKFEKAILSGKSIIWDSKDVYIFYKNGGVGKIQFRSFSSRAVGWQGEVKGAEANYGKISQGPLMTILARTFPGKHKTQQGKNIFAVSESSVIAEDVKYPEKLSEDFLQYFWFYYNMLWKAPYASGKKLTKQELFDGLKKQSPSWIYSKYLGMELLAVFGELTKKERDKLISEYVLYAMSSTPRSAPFIKVS
tara:strand:+ start:314 stop:1504 length:1191 start_codon:yes stop_codon:yes gene_type:complete